MELQFPILGYDASTDHRHAPPFTTPSALNVRPYSAKDGRRRGGSRPGTGLALPQYETLGAPILGLAQLDFIPDQSSVGVEGRPSKVFSESFDAISLTSRWANPPYRGGNQPLPLLLGFEKMAYARAGENRGNVIRLPDLNGERLYVVEAFVVPYNGEHNATYSLYAGLNGQDPNATQDGLVLDLTLGPGGSYVGGFRIFIGGSVVYQINIPTASTGFSAAGWLRLEVSKDSNDRPYRVRGTWYNRILFTASTALGVSTNAPAVGLKIQVPSNGKYGLVDTFRCTYVPGPAGNPDQPRTDRERGSRPLILAVAGGYLFRDLAMPGAIERVPDANGDCTLAGDRFIEIADHRQKAFIADWGPVKASGTNGTATTSYLTRENGLTWNGLGIDFETDVLEITTAASGAINKTYRIGSISNSDARLNVVDDAGAAVTIGDGSETAVNYRVIRGPKVYEPNNSSGQENLRLWFSNDDSSDTTLGQVPTGCHLIARCFGRIFLAGDPPHVWYASRQGDPFDWNYAATDVQRAVASTSGEQDSIGEPITALIPHTDDYLIFACSRSLWVMRGDPGLNGSVDAISREIGICVRHAWCRGPLGEVYLLSDDGFYRIPPGANSIPEALSRVRLPDELRRLSESTVTCAMAYNSEDFGIDIHLFSSSANRMHWFYDLANGGFWPVSINANKQPRVALRYSASSTADSGTIYGCEDGWIRRYSRRFGSDEESTFQAYVAVGPVPLAGDTSDAIIQQIDAKLDIRSGGAMWSIHSGETAQEAAESTVAAASGTWGPGLNFRENPMVAANSAVIKIESPENTPAQWQLESLSIEARPRGRQRKP